MLTLAWYLLKVMLVSGILFGYYWLALRNRKFHVYNRFYLIAMLVLSWIVPLLKINLWQETPIQPQVINLLSVVANGDRFVEKTDQLTWSWNKAALIISVLISIAFLMRLIVSIVKVYALICRNRCSKWNDVNFVLTDAKGTPFSFFKYIFWNDQIDVNCAEGKQILKHELTHVREKHSFDKVLLSAALIFSWYNPFVWLIKKELNMIHEFIADQSAVADGDVHSFAAMLLKTAFPAHAGMLTNSFFHSSIKRRLLMLTTISHPRYSYIRRLMALPLLAILTLFFAFRLKEKGINPQSTSAGSVLTNDKENRTPAQFPGGMLDWKRYLERNFDLNVLKEHNAPAGSYPLLIVFTVNTDGSISDVVAEKKAGYGTEEEAIRTISKGPKWIPAKKDGVFVDTQVEQTITCTVTKEGWSYVEINSIQALDGAKPFTKSIFAYTADTEKKENHERNVSNERIASLNNNTSSTSTPVTFTSVNTTSKDTEKLKKPLVILDGKEMKWEEFNKGAVTPETIESIKVLKDESAIKIYGDKGRDGVIIITLKGQNSDQKNFESQQKKFEAEQKNSEVQQKKFADEKKDFEAQQKKFEAEQQNQQKQSKYDRVFTVVENPPYYPNGMSAFADYIKSNLRYPKEALEKKIEGAVLIQFIVNEEGKLSDFKKLSAKGNGLEDEAIRLLKNSGDWKPGIQNGHKVVVQVQQQVVFELPKKS